MSDSAFSSVSQSLKTGTILHGYRIERLVSVEIDSFVYIAEELETKRRMTVKEHFPSRVCERDAGTGAVYCGTEEDQASFDESMDEFEQETLLLAKLDHPGVPRQHHLFPENGTLYRVSRFLSGYSLTALLKRSADCEWFYEEEELRAFLWRVLEVLRYVHGQGVYHFALKPRHIVFTRFGNPFLTHFCSRRELYDERQGSLGDGVYYLAPEQWREEASCGAFTDVYSLGAVFYRILSGKEPVRSDWRVNQESVLGLAGQPELEKSYSREFLAAIDRAMSIAPSDRFQTAEEWQRVLESQKGFARPCWIQTVPKSRRWKRFLWSVASLLVFAGVVWGGYKWLVRALEVPQPEAVAELTTELGTMKSEGMDGHIWGFQCRFRDYGFGVNYRNLPPVVSLESVSLEAGRARRGEELPPVRLSVRSQEGVPLALSSNSVSLNQGGLVTFQFDKGVALDSQAPYQYVLVTQEGAAVQAPVRLARITPLSPRFARSYSYEGTRGGSIASSVPLFSVTFAPDSGASPLTEARPDAKASQSPGYAQPRNWCLHPGTRAIQSSTYGTADAYRAVDGQMSGEMGCMTDPEQGRGWWLVSFGDGVDRPVGRVVVYNMPEGGAIESRRLSNFRISLFDRKGAEIIHRDFYTEPGTWVKDIAEVWNLPEPVMAHSVRVEKLGQGAHPVDAALYLAEVEVAAPEGKSSAEDPSSLKDWCAEKEVKAGQSSIRRNWVGTYGAYRAIDGNNNPKYYAQTENDNTPGWWQVDLGMDRPVESVVLHNLPVSGYEALRLSNYRVILTDAAGKVRARRDFYTTPGDYAPARAVWALEEPVQARTVRIEKLGKGTHPYDNALALPKVQVLGRE